MIFTKFLFFTKVFSTNGSHWNPIQKLTRCCS